MGPAPSLGDQAEGLVALFELGTLNLSEIGKGDDSVS
jgi:hypothetical protein